MYTENDKWYIDVTYLHEDDRYVKEIHIPKMHIPLEAFTDTMVQHHDWRDVMYFGTIIKDVRAVFGDLSLVLEDPKDDDYFTEKIIEEKTQEMTLDEIEKKLGYKIKIVNKK